MDKFRQVLLFGNGLNQSFGCDSWKDLLLNLAINENAKVWQNDEVFQAPMPLKTIILTNNKVNTQLRKNKVKLFGKPLTDEQVKIYLELLEIGFDEILTTNYSYELESALLCSNNVTEKSIANLLKYNKEHAETTYLLHTYNQIVKGDKKYNIWHIHGEARKPGSMVLGHYFYGNLLNKIIDKTNKRKDAYKNKREEINQYSWVDAFVLGDVYVLGLSLDFSEIDLWWLINRKINEKTPHGKIYFYEPIDNRKNQQLLREKIELLKILSNDGKHIEIIDLGMEIKKDEDYKEFYIKAIKHMKQRCN